MWPYARGRPRTPSDVGRRQTGVLSSDGGDSPFALEVGGSRAGHWGTRGSRPPRGRDARGAGAGGGGGAGARAVGAGRGLAGSAGRSEGALRAPRNCGAGGPRQKRSWRAGQRRNGVPRTAGEDGLKGGQTDGRKGQHAPTVAPRLAAAPGRHADLPGTPARALSPAPACTRANRPPAHLALAQPTRLLHPLHCIGDLGTAVVSEQPGVMRWPWDLSRGARIGLLLLLPSLTGEQTPRISPDSLFGKLPNQERLWETQGTWALAKSLLTLQSANSRHPERPGTGKTVGGGEGPRGGCNHENIPFLYSSIWQTPEMLVEIEMAWSISGYLLVCFSAGRLCPRKLRLGWKIVCLKCSVFFSFPIPSSRILYP